MVGVRVLLVGSQNRHTVGRPVATWVAGRYNILPALSAGTMSTSTSVKTTAARNISIVIASADLTAGVANVVLFAVPPLA